MFYLLLLLIGIPVLIIILISLIIILVHMVKVYGWNGKKNKIVDDVSECDDDVFDEETSVESSITLSPLVDMRLTIAGVTFKDGRLSRQSALRKLYFGDEPMTSPINFAFEQYEYEGKPAFKISANGRILGNVPASMVDDFIFYQEHYRIRKVKHKVYGGYNGKSFGCELTITWEILDDEN